MSLHPVLLLHGFTGSVRSTWTPTGIIDLLSEAGREVHAIDLPGHGTAEKHHDPEAYRDFERQLLEDLPATAFDGVGFSMGARTLLTMASHDTYRFGRLVVAGVGKNLFENDIEQHERIAAGVVGDAEPDDVHAQAFARYAQEEDQDPEALAAFMRRPMTPLGVDELSRVANPVLVVLGSDDFVGPADPLVDALPNAELVELRGVDHFATPKDFGFIDAVLEFLDAAPS